VEFADVTTYIAARSYMYVYGFSTIAGVGRGDSLVMLDRGNPRGRAVTSNHPPEI